MAVENGEVQFTDYGLSGICIMQLSGYLAPGRGPKRPAVELDLFPTLDETALTALFAARVPLLPGKAPADFWTGLLNPKLGRALWAAAKLPEKPVDTLPDAARTWGTGMDHYLQGDFYVVGEGNARFCLDPTQKCFLRVEAGGQVYWFTGDSEDHTAAIAQALQSTVHP